MQTTSAPHCWADSHSSGRDTLSDLRPQPMLQLVFDIIMLPVKKRVHTYQVGLWYDTCNCGLWHVACLSLSASQSLLQPHQVGTLLHLQLHPVLVFVVNMLSTHQVSFRLIRWGVL